MRVLRVARHAQGIRPLRAGKIQKPRGYLAGIRCNRTSGWFAHILDWPVLSSWPCADDALWRRRQDQDQGYRYPDDTGIRLYGA